jgi:group II intron reverse transcriptase/maturase/CRISPR-associated endonuclease Cas1
MMRMRGSLFGRASQAARTSLFRQRIADDIRLREAWHRVQRTNGMGGIDGVSVRDFRNGLERRLEKIRDSILTGTYQPQPLLRIEIPKPSGGVRALGIPTIADRLVQTSAAMLLHELIADLFSDRSYAYRPFLGPRRAALHMRKLLTADSWVVTADIEKFFDNVEHRILANQLSGAGVDDGGVTLILNWLTVPVQSSGRWFQPVKGLPQGSPVSPVLANWYLTPFDTALEADGIVHVRYADDFIAVAPDRTSAQRALSYVGNFLTSRLRLSVKPSKTQVSRAADGFNFVGFGFTPSSWTIPAESIDRFRNRIAEILHDPAKSLAAVARSHNDLVQGWVNYYLGNSSEMDAQMLDLETWRTEECLAFLRRAGHPEDANGIWFQRLAEKSSTAPARTYEQLDDAGRADEPTVGDDPWRSHSERLGRHPFSSVNALHDYGIGREQSPELSADGALRIPTHGAFVSRSRGILTVRRRKQIVFETPMDDLTAVAVEGEGVVLSTSLVAACAARGIPVALQRPSGAPIAWIRPARVRLDAALVGHQVRARAGRSGTELCVALLRAKLSNQRAMLLYHAKYARRDATVRATLKTAAGSIQVLAAQLGPVLSVPLKQARPTLFLVEARAAAHYWQGVAALVPLTMCFAGRRHRGAPDPVNKALNFGYWHLLNRVWTAVHRVGLEPALGLLHTGRRRSAGLVFDLMEPFRQPVVDRAVLGLIGRGADLSVSRGGALSLRSRTLVHRAIMRRLGAEPSASSLAAEIPRGVRRFRRALIDGTVYQPYRMPW